MADAQDWIPVVIKKHSTNKKTTLNVKGPTSSNNVNTVIKSVGNNPKKILSQKEFNSLDSNEEIKKPLMFSTTLGSKIATARTNLGLDRKKLAMNLSITENDLASVETGRKVFNQQLLSKINKILGTNFSKTD